jgi:opacity protein-like surface antigen
MKRFLIVMVSTLGVAGAAFAADLPARQPVPPPAAASLPIGKAPIGKGPIGKAPIGKAPIGKAPLGKAPVVAPAPGPIVTRG